MSVNETTLQKICEYRIASDPIIAHKLTQEWINTLPEDYIEQIYHARTDRLEQAPTNEPLQRATWPEATAHCFTQTMDARMDFATLLGVYQHCLNQTMQRLDYTSLENITPDSYEIIVTDEHKQLADELRWNIMQTQHKQFVKTEYDTLPFDPSGVPKAFWDADLESEHESADNNQAALTSF